MSLLQVLAQSSSGPHTTTHVSSHYYTCVLITLYVSSVGLFRCSASSSPPKLPASWRCKCVCVLILPVCVLVQVLCQLISAEVARILAREADFRCTAVHMCPHTTIYVSSYYYVCVLIILYVCVPYFRYSSLVSSIARGLVSSVARGLVSSVTRGLVSSVARGLVSSITLRTRALLQVQLFGHRARRGAQESATAPCLAPRGKRKKNAKKYLEKKICYSSLPRTSR